MRSLYEYGPGAHPPPVAAVVGTICQPAGPKGLTYTTPEGPRFPSCLTQAASQESQCSSASLTRQSSSVQATVQTRFVSAVLVEKLLEAGNGEMPEP